MLLAALFAIASVGAGTMLGLWPGVRAGWLPPVRGLAIGAALAVAFGSLLPEAIEQLGLLALGPLAAGFVAPSLIERVARRGAAVASASEPDRAATVLALEISYIGLLVHQLGDGLTMGAYAGPLHADALHAGALLTGGGRLDVFVAIAGHTVPVTAAVALAFLEHRGRAPAITHALGLVVPVLAGVALAQTDVAAHLMIAHGGWVSSLASGLLLHVVLHGTHHHERAVDHAAAPGGWLTRSRALEVVGIVVGAAVVLGLLPSHAHGEAEPATFASELPMLALAAVLLVALRFVVRHRGHARAPGCAEHEHAHEHEHATTDRTV